MGFPHVILDTHKKFQLNPTTTDSDIITHQAAVHKRYLLDIITSGSLEETNGTAKATVTNKSGNWDMWCKFLKHSGIADKLLRGGGSTRA